MNNSLLSQVIGNDTKVTVNVEMDTQSITKLCVGLLLVFVISLLVYGIIKKSI
jgi:hypothetical protein